MGEEEKKKKHESMLCASFSYGMWGPMHAQRLRELGTGVVDLQLGVQLLSFM